jgi:DNA-binding CsgD family transcriptional regulator
MSSPSGNNPGVLGRPFGSSRLSGRDLQIFAMHMQGVSNLEIASALSISPQTVSNTINSEFFVSEKRRVYSQTIDKITENAAGTFSPLTIAKANASRMMQLNVEIAETAKDPRVKLQAVHDILDRVLGKPKQRIAIEDEADRLLEKMSESELAAYAATGALPSWAEKGSSNDPDTNNGGTVH